MGTMDLFLYINVFVPAIVLVFSRPSDSAAIAKAVREADASTPSFRRMDGRNESIPIAESNDLKIHEELKKMDEELNKMDEDVNKMDEEVDGMDDEANEMDDEGNEMDKGADKIDEDKMNQRQLANASVTTLSKMKKLVRDIKQDNKQLKQEKEQLESYIQAKHKEYSVMSAFYQEREQERKNSAKSNPNFTPTREDWENVKKAVEIVDEKMLNQGTLQRTIDCSQFNFDATKPNVGCSKCQIPKVGRDEESGCDKWECAHRQCNGAENIPIESCESECDHVKVVKECGCDSYHCVPPMPPMQQCSADRDCGECEQCVEKPWVSQKCSEKTGFKEHYCERKNCTELPGMPICLEGEKKRQDCNHCECMSGFWACKKAPCIVKPTKIPEICPPGMRGTQPYCRPVTFSAVPKPDILTTGVCATSPQLPCCNATANTYKFLNEFKMANVPYPTCRPDGYFAAKQCNWDKCYCVKPNGEDADGRTGYRDILCRDAPDAIGIAAPLDKCEGDDCKCPPGKTGVQPFCFDIAGDDQATNHFFAEFKDPEVEDPEVEDPEKLLTSKEIRNLPKSVLDYDDETYGKTIDELMGNSADIRMPEIEFKKDMGKHNP